LGELRDPNDVFGQRGGGV